jgi:predicted nucleotidyltransferase
VEHPQAGGVASTYNGAVPARGTEEALRELLAAEPPGILAAYLFGSVARGTAHARRDVDVAVLHADTPAATLEGLPLDLEDRIRRRLGRPAQVVVRQAPGPPSRERPGARSVLE